MESNAQFRQCGECQLCCFVYTVPEMEKPRMEPCKHQCDQGCAIHNEPRPELCTAFRCEWIESESPLPDEFRPDKCGMMFQLRPVTGWPSLLYRKHGESLCVLYSTKRQGS